VALTKNALKGRKREKAMIQLFSENQVDFRVTLIFAGSRKKQGLCTYSLKSQEIHETNELGITANF